MTALSFDSLPGVQKGISESATGGLSSAAGGLSAIGGFAAVALAILIKPTVRLMQGVK